LPPFEIRVDDTRRIVVARALGTIDEKLALGMVAQAREQAVKCGFNILYDMREARPGDMSSGALFWMPRQLQVLKGAGAKRVRVALLHPPEYGAMASYWEDAFGNAGLRVKAFAADEPGAVAWLTALG
jgi:hypothetical protein